LIDNARTVLIVVAQIRALANVFSAEKYWKCFENAKKAKKELVFISTLSLKYHQSKKYARRQLDGLNNNPSG